MEVYAVMGDSGASQWLCTLWFTREEAQKEADRLGEEFPSYVYSVEKYTVYGKVS